MEKLQDAAENLYSDIKKFHKIADQEYDNAEDALSAGRQRWVAQGNHPDDYNSTPEGVRLERIALLTEDVESETRRGDLQDYALKIDDELQELRKRLGKLT
jgi:hypothetical protein